MNPIQNLSQFDNPVRACVERALVQAGLAHLPFADRADAAAALTAEAYQRIGLELLAHLDDLSLAEFRRLVEFEASADELASFFRVRVPDLEVHAQKALAGLSDEVVRAAEEARSAASL
jgi:hypothetical protein